MAACISPAGFLTLPTPGSHDPMWRIAKGRWLIALAGFRSRPHRSAGTPNTLDLSPLPFTLTAQEGRVFSNLATANPALERPHLELYGVVAYVCSKAIRRGILQLLLTTKPAEMRHFIPALTGAHGLCQVLSGRREVCSVVAWQLDESRLRDMTSCVSSTSIRSWTSRAIRTGCWARSTDKPELYRHVKQCFASRKEDGSSPARRMETEEQWITKIV
jgi:hypothetical protein